MILSLGTTSTDIASAITRQEGFYPGSRSYRNNNPGNLMYAGQAGATGKDADGFAIFDTLTKGQAAEVNQVNMDVGRGMTLTQLLTKWDTSTAPTYTANVASWTGLPTDVPLSTVLIADAGDAFNAFGGPLPVDAPPYISLDGSMSALSDGQLLAGAIGILAALFFARR